MKIVLLGQIASGKGTLSQALQEKYGFEAVSIGLLLREEALLSTPEAEIIKTCQEKGELVPNDLTLKILQKNLAKKKDAHLIFDGYPRNLEQAQSLDKIAKIDKVIFINISNDIVRERFLGRRECNKCGYVSNVNYAEYTPSCPRCDGTFAKRNDLNEQAMQNKMASFEKDTLPLVEYYKQKNLLVEIEGSDGKDIVLEQVRKVLNLK